MKTLFIVTLLILLEVGCQSIKINTKTDLLTNNTGVVTAKDDYLYSQNDLVYHDYVTGVKLSNNSKLIITQLDLNLNVETAIIYVQNLKNNETIKLYDYHPNQNISYTPNSEGVYKIFAVISNGEIIDVTPKAIIEVSFTPENTGFIKLR